MWCDLDILLVFHDLAIFYLSYNKWVLTENNRKLCHLFAASPEPLGGISIARSLWWNAFTAIGKVFTAHALQIGVDCQSDLGLCTLPDGFENEPLGGIEENSTIEKKRNINKNWSWQIMSYRFSIFSLLSLKYAWTYFVNKSRFLDKFELMTPGCKLLAVTPVPSSRFASSLANKTFDSFDWP